MPINKFRIDEPDGGYYLFTIFDDEDRVSVFKHSPTGKSSLKIYEIDEARIFWKSIVKNAEDIF